MSLSDLRRFREDAPEPEPLPDEESVEPSWSGRILAVDQAIAFTGWAVIEVRGGEVIVTFTGNEKTEARYTSHEDTLYRGTVLYRRFVEVVQGHRPDVIVHEYPPVGGRMARPESSLTAAMALRCAAKQVDPSPDVEMVAAQKAKKFLTGNGNAKKGEVRKALEERFPSLLNTKPMNVNVRDAIAVGVTWAQEE